MLKAIQRCIIALTIVSFVIVQRELFRSRIIDYSLLMINEDIQSRDASSFIRFQRVECYTSLDLVASVRHKFQLMAVSSDTQYSSQAFDKGNFNADELNSLIVFLFEKQVFLLDVNILSEYKLNMFKSDLVIYYVSSISW